MAGGGSVRAGSASQSCQLPVQTALDATVCRDGYEAPLSLFVSLCLHLCLASFVAGQGEQYQCDLIESYE